MNTDNIIRGHIMRSHIKKLKETPETSLAGTIWTPNEEEKLIDSLRNKKELSEIAKEHKRTIGGIKIRAQSIALRMIQTEGKTMKEVCELLNLSPEDIEQPKKKQKHPISESETLKVLNDILTVLIRIESALTKNNTIEHQ